MLGIRNVRCLDKKAMKRFTLILIAFTLVTVILLIVLYRHYSVAEVDWDRTKTIFEVVQSACTILAILGGAAWAYFNFFKGRTYRPRLEPTLSGKFISKDGASYLVTTAQLKNVGLSRVKIKQEGSALQIFSYQIATHVSKVHELKQEYLAIFSVFEAHGWIEPNEVIEDQRFLVMPGGSSAAIRLELRIVSDGIEWNVATIVEPILNVEAQSRVLIKDKERKDGERPEARLHNKEQG